MGYEEEDPFKVENLSVTCPEFDAELPQSELCELDNLLAGETEECLCTCEHCGTTFVVRLSELDEKADMMIRPL